MSEHRPAQLSLQLLSFAYFSMGTSTLAVVGTLPQMAISLGLSQSDIAFLVAVFALTFALSAPAIQIFVGHRSHRSLLLGGLVLMALGTIGSALSPNYGSLLISRIIAAIGAAGIGPVASALGSSLVPPRQQAYALTIVFSGMTLATVLGVPLSAWLGASLGWRLTFIIIGLVTLLAATLVARFAKEAPTGRRLNLSHLLDVLIRPATAAGIAVMVFEMAGLFASYTMIVPTLHTRFGVGSHEVSAVLMVYGVAGVFGNFLARRIAHSWSADRTVLVALSILILVFAALYLAPNWPPIAIVILIVWAIGSDIFMPSQQRRMIELAPDIRGLVLALNSSAIYVGMAVGSFTAGSLYSVSRLSGLPIISIIFISLSFTALLFSRRSGQVSN